MVDILKHITEKLHGNITEANFEGANIVIYTDNEKFFKEGEGKVKELKGSVFELWKNLQNNKND